MIKISKITEMLLWKIFKLQIAYWIRFKKKGHLEINKII